MTTISHQSKRKDTAIVLSDLQLVHVPRLLSLVPEVWCQKVCAHW